MTFREAVVEDVRHDCPDDSDSSDDQLRMEPGQLP